MLILQNLFITKFDKLILGRQKNDQDFTFKI